jgi:hypothetical protein
VLPVGLNLLGTSKVPNVAGDGWVATVTAGPSGGSGTDPVTRR